MKMARKSIKITHNPFCRIPAFKFCKKCKYYKECFPNTRKHKILRVRQHQNWDVLNSKMEYAKKCKKSIHLILNRPVPNEIIWNISYSPYSVIQINIKMSEGNTDWISKLVHLAEKCGILVILVFHTIIPQLVKVYDVLKILDTVKNCSNYRVILNYSLFFVYGHFKRIKYLNIRHHKISSENLQFVWGKTWRCSDEFISEFQKLVEFYTTHNGIRLRVCKGAILNEANSYSGLYQPSHKSSGTS